LVTGRNLTPLFQSFWEGHTDVGQAKPGYGLFSIAVYGKHKILVAFTCPIY
jgi:hypothetical protein